MNKAKICGFAIMGIIGFANLSPIATASAGANTESATLSETKKDQKDNRAAFEEKMKQAKEKWDALTDKQKEEVYALLENEMEEENKVMEKLVEFGVMDKNDVMNLKAFKAEKFDKLKQSGEFPFFRRKGK